MAVVLLRARASLLVVLALLACAGAALGAPRVRTAEEHVVKAALIYQLGKFVTWPESTFQEDASPFVIGILGEGPVLEALQEIVQEKKIQGRRVRIVRFEKVTDIDAAQMLYVQKGALKNLDVLRAYARHYNILTMGETARFVDNGGMVLMEVDGDNIVFDIHEGEARRAGLRISASLLDIARRVVREEFSGDTP